MTKHLMLVYTSPTTPEDDEAYNEWYDKEHLPEMRAVPGVIAATRYRLAPGGTSAEGDHRYLAVYETDGHPSEVLAATRGGRTSAPPPAVDMRNARIQYWEPLD